MFSVYNPTLTTTSLPKESEAQPSVTIFQALLVIGVVASVFSVMALMSQSISDPSFFKIREITTQAGVFFGTDGLTFSVCIFTFSAAGTIGGASGWMMVSHRPQQKQEADFVKEQPVKSSPATKPLPILANSPPSLSSALAHGAPLVIAASLGSDQPIPGSLRGNSGAVTTSGNQAISVARSGNAVGALLEHPSSAAGCDSQPASALGSAASVGSAVAVRASAHHAASAARSGSAVGALFEYPSSAAGCGSQPASALEPAASVGSAGAVRASAHHAVHVATEAFKRQRGAAAGAAQAVEISLGNVKFFIDLTRVTKETLPTLFKHLQAAYMPHPQTALIPANQPQLCAETVHALLAQAAFLEEDFVEIPPVFTEYLPRGNMRDYVQRVCPTYKNTFEALAAKGKEFVELFKKTKKGDANSPEVTIGLEKRRGYGAPFVWHLMTEAQTGQGKAFGEGMLGLRDDGYRIHDFFAAVATRRSSSHYKKSRLTSYGMDIVQDDSTGLPGGHQTMHFGKREILDPEKASYIFVKPESWGTESWWQMGGHTLSYVLTRFPHLLGLASQEGEFKEHTPPKCTASFKALIAKIAPGETVPIKEWGVAGMVYFLKDFLLKEGMDGIAEKKIAAHKALIRQFLIENNLTLSKGAAATQGEEVVIADAAESNRLNAVLAQLLALLSPPSARSVEGEGKSKG